MTNPPVMKAPRSLPLCREALIALLRELSDAFTIAHYYPEVAPADYDEKLWEKARVLGELLGEELELLAVDYDA
jgi:hypothetical protein